MAQRSLNLENPRDQLELGRLNIVLAKIDLSALRGIRVAMPMSPVSGCVSGY